jgi:ribonuclease HI
MAKRRKKKIPRVIHLSVGPLPLRLAEQFTACPLLFSDASQQGHGGLAVVLYDDAASEPIVVTRRVPVTGSNELELLAALTALAEATRRYPGQPVALFSDNQDAVTRLNRAREQGLEQDPELADMLLGQPIDLAQACIRWIPGHSNCRGNALADLHAREAAQ